MLAGCSQVLDTEPWVQTKPGLGEAALVLSVTERLMANGVATVAREGCPAVRVHLERRGQQLHLRVADGYQRRGEREVQDIATAAAVIGSWTLQEVEEGALPELVPPATMTVVLVPAVRLERFGIAVSGHSSMADDGTAWLGGEVAGCVRQDVAVRYCGEPRAYALPWRTS